MEYDLMACTQECLAYPIHHGHTHRYRQGNDRDQYTAPQRCHPMHWSHQENRELCPTNDRSSTTCRHIAHALDERRVRSLCLLLWHQLHRAATQGAVLPMNRHTCLPNGREYRMVHVDRTRRQTKRIVHPLRGELVHLQPTNVQLLA